MNSGLMVYYFNFKILNAKICYFLILLFILVIPCVCQIYKTKIHRFLKSSLRNKIFEDLRMLVISTSLLPLSPEFASIFSFPNDFITHICTWKKLFSFPCLKCYIKEIIAFFGWLAFRVYIMFLLAIHAAYSFSSNAVYNILVHEFITVYLSSLQLTIGLFPGCFVFHLFAITANIALIIFYHTFTLMHMCFSNGMGLDVEFLSHRVCSCLNFLIHFLFFQVISMHTRNAMIWK